MKSRMRENCTYGSVRGTEDTANSHYDILEQYKVEKRGGCRGSVYSTVICEKDFNIFSNDYVFTELK